MGLTKRQKVKETVARLYLKHIGIVIDDEEQERHERGQARRTDSDGRRASKCERDKTP